VRTLIVGEFPRLSGSLKWTGDNGTVANLNAVYDRWQREVIENRNLNSQPIFRLQLTGNF
jgi:hypothetical protein